MKKHLFLISCVILLLSCTMIASPSASGVENESGTGSAPPSGGEANVSPTNPPEATSIPTFTPTPVSRVASPENIGAFVQETDYWDQVVEQIGMPLYDGVIFDFVISQDGSRFAMGFCMGGD